MTPVQVRDTAVAVFELARHQRLLTSGGQITAITATAAERLAVTFADGTRAVLAVAEVFPPEGGGKP